MDFAFYDMKSARGWTSVLNIIFLLNRFPFFFLCRSKRAPLVVLQWLLNILKARKRAVMRIRADEDGSLAKYYGFNVLLLDNNLQVEKKRKTWIKIKHNHWKTKQGKSFENKNLSRHAVFIAKILLVVCAGTWCIYQESNMAWRFQLKTLLQVE